MPADTLCLKEQGLFLDRATELADDGQRRDRFVCVGISCEDADANTQIGPQPPERLTKFTFRKSGDYSWTSALWLEYLVPTGPPKLFTSGIKEHFEERIHINRKSTMSSGELGQPPSIPSKRIGWPVQMLTSSILRLKVKSANYCLFGEAGAVLSAFLARQPRPKPHGVSVIRRAHRRARRAQTRPPPIGEKWRKMATLYASSTTSITCGERA